MVTRGPTTPVCRPGIPCSEPATNEQLVFVRDDRVTTAIASTGADGRYTVALKPGLYTVTILPVPAIGRGFAPQTVRVIAGRTRTVDFSIDTGIR